MSNLIGMRRATPRSFVPSKRLKAEHRRHGNGASLKSFALSMATSAAGIAGGAQKWLFNKTTPPMTHLPSAQGRPGWTNDGRSRLGLGAPMTSPSGHVAAGCIFGI